MPRHQAATAVVANYDAGILPASNETIAQAATAVAINTNCDATLTKMAQVYCTYPG